VSAAALYEQRKLAFETEAARLKKRYAHLSWLRALLFLSLSALLIYLFGRQPLAGAAAVLPVVGLLGFFVRQHEKLSDARKRAARLADINAEETRRLSGDYLPLDEGRDFANPDHPYSADLDLFGRHSLYAFLCRARTPHGRHMLAAWLQSPASAAEIKLRQEAVAEISAMTGLRQDLLYHAEKTDRSLKELSQLAKWGKEETGGKGSPLLIMTLRYGYSLLTLAAIAWSMAGNLNGWIPLGLFLGSFLILKPFSKEIALSQAACNGHARTLKRFEGIFRAVSRSKFQSRMLLEIQQTLGDEAAPAVQKLSRLSAAFDSRLNALVYLFGNGLLLRDLGLMLKTRKWLKRYGPCLDKYFLSAARLEALASLGNLLCNRPSFTFPLICEGEYQMEMKDAGHPLIPGEKCVRNDLSMQGRGRLELITGSNMAGKSTYLRSIGINIVLAQAGAPVMASAARLSPTRLISSMRNADALDANISSFYAELLRLKLILDESRRHDNVFFLIDEILKGTNSTDRHKGSVALLGQLVKAGGCGLISTHDLELAEKAGKMDGVRNFSFEVDIRGGRLSFDYKKHPGICHSLNATLLMKQMGIEIDESRE